MFGVSVADVKLAGGIWQADPALFEAIKSGKMKITLAQAGRKVKKQRKATALSRRLAELGIAGLVTEKEAKRAMALARLPKGIFEALADGKITLTQAKRRAKDFAVSEKGAREAVALVSLPEDLREAFADGEITRTAALRRAKGGQPYRQKTP
jgi:hypothetical protein